MTRFNRLPLFLLPLVSALPAAAQDITPIGVVQGTVLDTQRGTAHKSPFAGDKAADGKMVTVQGVVTGRTLATEKNGDLTSGFFLQNTLATADKDPNSSDGIWVFMGKFATLRSAGGGPAYTPKKGDEVVLTARVVEYYGQTQLSSARVVNVVRSGVDLDAETPAFDVNPPDDIEAANRYWERHEGMRGTVPAGSLVVMGRHILGGGDGEVDLIRADHPIAKRTNPYERRSFRDFHPLDDVPGITDNGNGYRIDIGAQGLKGATGDAKANLDPVRTFATLNNAVTGGVMYSFGRYVVEPQDAPKFTAGADPSLNGAPRAPDRATEYSIATFNVENLYDFRDDPNDACDFKGNAGCEGVTPPFDYVPDSQAEYDAHRVALAHQIVEDLHSPDVIMVEEAEDQDICKVENGQMACGTADNADGQPDTVQELALEVQKLGGPRYVAAFDRDAADKRGIIPAFMLRADTASLEPVTAETPVFGTTPQLAGFTNLSPYDAQVSNPKALNAPYDKTGKDVDGTNVFTRAPQVAAIRIKHPDGTSTLVYCIANHFSSRPNKLVEQRKTQAAFSAAIAGALLKANPAARVVLGGDLNVQPRPDDPFSPLNRRTPSDQLSAIYDTGLFSLFDVMVREDPASAYSYVFEGQAQTIDHFFVSRNLRVDLKQVREAHINADWPGAEAIDQGGKMRGSSDHDPCLAIFSDKPQPIPANLDAERPGPIKWGVVGVDEDPEAENGAPKAVAAAPAEFVKVNVNTATEEELMTLPYIRKSTAEAIIAYRQQNGPFKTVDDLDAVKGIGPATIAKIRGLVGF